MVTCFPAFSRHRTEWEQLRIYSLVISFFCHFVNVSKKSTSKPFNVCTSQGSIPLVLQLYRSLLEEKIAYCGTAASHLCSVQFKFPWLVFHCKKDVSVVHHQLPIYCRCINSPGRELKLGLKTAVLQQLLHKKPKVGGFLWRWEKHSREARWWRQLGRKHHQFWSKTFIDITTYQ